MKRRLELFEDQVQSYLSLPLNWSHRRPSLKTTLRNSELKRMLSCFLPEPLRKVTWNSLSLKGCMPITSLNFQELVTSMELGLWVEKASGPTVRTRRYLPFHECLVTKNDEAAGLMAIIFLIFNTFLSDSTCFSEKTNFPRFFHSFVLEKSPKFDGKRQYWKFRNFLCLFW